ncbi:MAG TPA: leucine-rich repeat domain-containing protein [Clostridia bacterium]|nr:leucine-rich repeat domain-containing protein [Clostridia bacterium]
MKKLILILIVIAIVVTTILTLTACDKDTYKIAWVDENGSVLQIDEKVEGGTVPQYLGATPEKADDENYIYVFAGWSTEVVEATEATVYVAKFNRLDKKQYCNITWKNYDDSIIKVDKGVEKGTTPEYIGEEPKRPDDETYSYKFREWTPEIVEATEDATYTAEYKKFEKSNCFTIVWENYDGTILQVDPLVEKGTIPEYKGEIPTRGSDDVFAYAFRGWTPEVVAATKDAIYTADFQKVDKFYTVTWKNWDGKVLAVDTNILYGALPQYTGPAPMKESNEIYDYMFMGWSPSVTQVTCDVTYIASFAGIKRKYTVTWIDTAEFNYNTNSWRTVLYTEEVEAGSTPQYRGPELKKLDDKRWNYKYVFDTWEPVPDRLVKDMEFTAKYVEAYDVSWYNWSTGPELIKTERRKKELEVSESGYERYVIPDDIEYDGPAPTIPDDEGYTYEFKDWYQCERWSLDGAQSHRKMVEREFVATYGCISKDERYAECPRFSYCPTTQGTGLPTIRIDGYAGDFFSEFYIPAWLEGNIVQDFASVRVENGYQVNIEGIFENNKVIQTVYLGNNLRNIIGRYTFRGCTSLHTIHFGKNMTSIGEGMFEDCTALRKVDIPAPINTIKRDAFRRCTNLLSVNLPDTLESIGISAFSECTSLTSIILPDSVNKLWGYIFCDCTRLKNFVVGKGVTSISNGCFRGATALRNIDLLDSNVKHIGQYAFKECTSLPSINFPVTLETIDEKAFEKCINLLYVEFANIGPRLRSIGDFAFLNCEMLGALSIPGSVTQIGYGIVNYCDRLTNLEMDTPNDKYKSTSEMIIDKEAGMIVAGCNGSGAIPTDSYITIIEAYAFTGSKHFSRNKALIIPDNIKEIRDWAFAGCSGVRSHRSDHVVHVNHDESCVMSAFVPRDCTYAMRSFYFDCGLLGTEDANKYFCVYVDYDVTGKDRYDEGFLPSNVKVGKVYYHYRCEAGGIFTPDDYPPSKGQAGLGTMYGYWHYKNGVPKLWTAKECWPNAENPIVTG